MLKILVIIKLDISGRSPPITGLGLKAGHSRDVCSWTFLGNLLQTNNRSGLKDEDCSLGNITSDSSEKLL